MQLLHVHFACPDPMVMAAAVCDSEDRVCMSSSLPGHGGGWCSTKMGVTCVAHVTTRLYILASSSQGRGTYSSLSMAQQGHLPASRTVP